MILLSFMVSCTSRLEVSGVTTDSKEFKSLPSIMRDFPIWEPIDKARYDFEVRDGARAPSGGLTYKTGLSEDGITERFQQHAQSLGCQLSSSKKQQLHFTCQNKPSQRLELYLKSSSSLMLQVNVLFLQTTPEFEKVSF
jgi:hypothetical protein